jgi:hypothetical protein
MGPEPDRGTTGMDRTRFRAKDGPELSWMNAISNAVRPQSRLSAHELIECQDGI